MDDNATPTNTQEPTPTSPPTPAPTGEPWKAGSHSRFAGRTAEEILGIAEGLASVAERFNQPVPQPEPPKNRFDYDIPDEDYLTGRQVKDILQRFQNQPPPVDSIARQQVLSLTVGQLKEKYKDEFKRWPQEIEAECRKLPQEYWTLDTLSTCVDIVKSRHVDELAAEKAQRLVNESHPTIRSGTGGSGSVPQTQNVFETGNPQLLRSLEDAGIKNEADLRRACEGTGITPEQYLAEFAKFGNGAIIRG